MSIKFCKRFLHFLYHITNIAKIVQRMFIIQHISEITYVCDDHNSINSTRTKAYYNAILNHITVRQLPQRINAYKLYNV
jgi:hypothetical protein